VVVVPPSVFCTSLRITRGADHGFFALSIFSGSVMAISYLLPERSQPADGQAPSQRYCTHIMRHLGAITNLAEYPVDSLALKLAGYALRECFRAAVLYRAGNDEFWDPQECATSAFWNA
jgi:hypothetical protein